MDEACVTISPLSGHVIAVLARQRAVKAVKCRLRAKGLRPWRIPHRAIAAQADEYLAEHRQRLIEQAAEMVHESAELSKRMTKNNASTGVGLNKTQKIYTGRGALIRKGFRCANVTDEMSRQMMVGYAGHRGPDRR
jgi:hypothetical protein